MKKMKRLIFLAITLLAIGFAGFAQAAELVSGTEFSGDNKIIVKFSKSVESCGGFGSGPLCRLRGGGTPISGRTITGIEVSTDGKEAVITFAGPSQYRRNTYCQDYRYRRCRSLELFCEQVVFRLSAFDSDLCASH